MNFALFLIFLALLFLTISSVVECILKPGDQTYCKDKILCPPGDLHITCNNDWQIAVKCRPVANLYQFTNDDKQKLVNAHNIYRNILASGKLLGFKSAARMATMKWDDDLAQMAELNVKTCNFAHDKCRNIPQYKYSGQNLFIMGILPKPNDLKDKLIKESVEKWWLEYKDADMSYVQKFRPPEKLIGHFTVMAVDRNFRLGCAALEQNRKNGTTVVLGCNYASTNLINFPLYKIGEPASGCKTGQNKEYPALCSPEEIYNINTFEGILAMYS